MRHFYGLLLTILLLSAAAPGATLAAEPPLVSVAGAPSWVYPQRRENGGYSILIHAPQIQSWPKFQNMEALAAVELTPPGRSMPLYGTVSITGSTEVDQEARIVKVLAPEIAEVRFTDELAAADNDAIGKLVATRDELDVPLDLFLAYLADDVLSQPPPPGFSTEAPPIVVASKPTLLLFVNGQPVLTELADTGLQVVANANWPTFRDPQAGGRFYLLDRDLWLTSEALDGGWKAAKTLPAGFGKLPVDGELDAIRVAVPLKQSAEPVPAVVFVDRPTELIVTDGEPKLAAIPGAEGLQYVTNTGSPLFRLDARWYFLVAGRWFTTIHLDHGPWVYSPELPEAFSEIPRDHPMAAVLASVPGTVEARTAALEALLPTRVTTARDAKPPVEVTYAGEPKFEPIPDTEVARAVNSGYDVIKYDNHYYLCYAGVWYQGDAPAGPWSVAASIPAAIYAIPPSSEAYPVTQVTVVESTPTTVIYSYPPSYSSSVYVVYGVPYYGTGWYYPPYVYGGYYYPYWGSYGHGSWYNPATGRYGSRSVWYGPYGGYSYTEGYNPRTGRYGYMETAWDGDEWGSHGQTYNPRTGVSTETDRYYNEDKNKMETDRTVQRGDQSIRTQRNTDFDDQTSKVSRETAGGASSSTKRSWEDGTLTSSGTVTTGDGRTATISGEQTRTGGNTTISGAGGSADLTTERQGGRSVTSIEGSGGGQGMSVSGQGPGRTTVGESGSGDLYAGHNGNVYKKTDDGWQQYDKGDWQPVGSADRAQAGAARQTASAATGSRDFSYSSADRPSQSTAYSRSSDQWGNQRPQRGNLDSRNYSRLNRDFSARQRGNQQFQQRGGGRRAGQLQGRGRRR